MALIDLNKYSWHASIHHCWIRGMSAVISVSRLKAFLFRRSFPLVYIYRNFCSACAVTLSFADTLIVLFLLTYLLTYSDSLALSNSPHKLQKRRHWSSALHDTPVHFPAFASIMLLPDFGGIVATKHDQNQTFPAAVLWLGLELEAIQTQDAVPTCQYRENTLI